MLVALVVFVAGVAGIRAIAVRAICMCSGNSRVDLTEIQVDRYARIHVPAWMKEHDRCPSPTDLGQDDATDPWGHPLVFACATGGEVIVRSTGPDGRLHSADDITSR